MIKVTGLAMRYGAREALRGVSFEIGRGEIAALLGPNGAGKTTMLRLLTCFLEPAGGDAELAGCSVRRDPDGVRRAVGYLPENVPLYQDMRVHEYLGYRAALRGLPRRRRRDAIAGVLERCGLLDRRDQIIGTLSRGYRQRVGLADAVLADPPILILDEPTSGLDPNQAREVRDYIRELGRERTILLSTHILPEAELLAGRVLILSQGRLVAEDAPERLRQRLAGRQRLTLEVRPEDAEAAARIAAGIAGVTGVAPHGSGRLSLEVEPGRDVRDDLFRAIAAAGLGLRELHAETASLEEVFSRITTAEQPGDGS